MRHSAPARPVGFRAALLVSASALALTAVPAAAEGPTGGVTARGKAAISAGPSRTTVRQTTRRAIIDWKSFDVSRDHVVDFVQPGKGAATLNRVDGARRSVIEGAVRAPGTVVIQNRAGVVFTRDARVDVGSLVAASQDIDAGRFQRTGRLVIGGGEAAGARVVNEGRITVGEKGLAALVGGSVENAGVIVARRGAVALASGARTTLDLAGDGVLRIAVKGDASGAAPGVVNTGVIDASEGRVLLSAGAAARALDAAINTTGLIRASSATGAGGAVELSARGQGVVRLGGAIDVSGRSGGRVTVTGARVELAPAARIDARGAVDGGRVRLGGERAGKGALRRAASLGMAAGASIDASGASGRGGDVVLWSDGVTAVDGAIRAAGAKTGGFVETSGAGALAVGAGAFVNPGAGGTWLLDPRDVVIGTGAGAAGVGAGVNAPPATGTGPWIINAGAVVTALNGGVDVTITTAQPGFADAGDITVSTAVGWSGAGDLRLDADGSIFVNANLQATGAGGLTLKAGAGDITVGAGGGARAVSTRTGDLRFEAPRGEIVLSRTNNQSSSVQVYSESGRVDLVAGERIRLEGGAVGGRWVRVGRTTDAADVRLEAPEIVIKGGSAGNNFAEVVAGPGGSIEMRAGLISVLNGAGDQGRIQATDGATLTLLAERQVWNGPVRSGTGGNNGGAVRIAGAITAGFQPQFSLLRDSGFTFLPAAPGGTASSYSSTEPFAVDIIPTVSAPGATGRIDIDAPVKAAQITLETEAGVRLGRRGMLSATEGGDALVVAAGAEFRNESALGADAFVLGDDEARWLLYIDAFGGLVGPAPALRDFDLYGRTYASDPPLAIGFEGNRIVYGERPTLTLTGERLEKTYGEGVSFGPGRPGYVATGLRAGDSLATALESGPVASSAGAAATAGVGSYAVDVAAAASAQGYIIETIAGVICVRRAPLTITAADSRRSYGAANPAFTAQFSGFVNGEGAGVLGGALRFDTAGAAASDVGRYAVAPSGLTSGNYAITYVPGTMTIDPAVLTVAIDDQRRSYGSAAFDGRAFTASGFVLGQGPGVLSGALATDATQASNVGAYGIGKGTLAAANYVIVADPGTLTIDPAVLTVAIDDQRRSYGSAAFDGRGFTASGFVLGQGPDVLSGALATDATQASNVGAYGIGKGTLAAANYVIAAAPGTLTIDPAVLTVAIDDQRRSYGSAAFDGRAFTATGFVLGQGPGVLSGALATDATQASNVGAYGIGKGTLAAANYVIAAAPGTLTIDPAVLTVAIDDQRRSYGSAAFDGRAFTVSGFVLGQGPGVLSGALATEATQASNVGAYGIGKGTLAAANYVIAADEGVLAITPARMRVRANDAQRSYGGDEPALSVRYLDPFVLGQSAGGLGWRPTVANAATQASNVGVYALTPGGIESGNYAVEYLPGRLTVNPADLRVTIHDQTRDYGAADPRFTWEAEGFVLGQGPGTVTGAPTSGAGRGADAGSYDIEAGTLAAANYRIWASTGVLTIEPVVLDLRIHDQRKTYGAANPRLGWEATGFVLGEDASVVSGALATAAGTRSGAGSYAITTGTLNARNYVIPDVRGTLTIDPAALTVTAEDAARPQGAANPAFVARYEGFVLGEGAADLGGRLVFTTDATAASPSGRYDVTPGGLVGPNYAITFRPGTLTVQPLPTPSPPPPAPAIAAIDGSLDLPERGLPPYTPGDAAFRTTKYEAPIARDSTFRLTYSLGEIVQEAPAGAGQGGFVPASGAAGSAAADGGGGGGTCGGPIGLAGAETGCVRSASAESFWTTTFPGAAR